MKVDIKIKKKGVYMKQNRTIKSRVDYTAEDCLNLYNKAYAVDKNSRPFVAG
jgi:hypothetical protein